MVAKGFLAAAAIIICCGSTLRGNDPDGTCTDGDCPTASSDKQPCSAEGKCCAEGKCDDKEECCEQEQVAVEKCSTEKCSAEKRSTGECAKSKCSAEKCTTEKCSTEKCTAEKSAAGKCSGEKCVFSACADKACDSLKCALGGNVKIGCDAEGACATSKCSTEKCRGESCPVAACAGQVCDALKCVLQSYATASDDDCCLDAVCATGTCGTSQCATLQCSGPDCPAGQCDGAPCSDEVCSGLKCAVEACLTASGGQLKFTATKSFVGKPVEGQCSKETCSTECGATTKCVVGQCTKSECNATQQAVRIVNEDRSIQQEMLVSKLAEQHRLQREIEMLRRLVDTTEVEARLNEGQSAYETALLAAAAIEPDCITRVYPVPDLHVWKVRPDGVEFDADLLIDYIVATVDPQSWRGGVYSDPRQAERANGEISPFPRNGSLVICQTEGNHERIAELFQKMRVDGQQKEAAREQEEALRNADKLGVTIEMTAEGVVQAHVVTPASAEKSTTSAAKCGKGACSESKCNGSKCSKSEVSLESESTDECPGDCQGDCNGECPETASCPCIGGTCTR